MMVQLSWTSNSSSSVEVIAATPSSFMATGISLITGDYLRSLGISLVEKIAGPDLIVIHGDELCTNDHGYQEFEKRFGPQAGLTLFLINRSQSAKL